MRSAWLPFVTGFVAGALALWLLVTVSVGWYSYQLWGESNCKSIATRGMEFDAGTEIVPGQANPCYHRSARFHLP